MERKNSPEGPQPFTFLFAEATQNRPANASEDDCAAETDTKDPYSDNSDTL